MYLLDNIFSETLSIHAVQYFIIRAAGELPDFWKDLLKPFYYRQLKFSVPTIDRCDLQVDLLIMKISCQKIVVSLNRKENNGELESQTFFIGKIEILVIKYQR
jgi:hypothetical protein